MTTINGIPFSKRPNMCGSCPALCIKPTEGKGYCVIFNKRKNRWDSSPKQCREIFIKALSKGGNWLVTEKVEDEL
ncbi:MAG: hypothetical protein ACLUGY_08625 [Phocaeicola massiliensis]